MYCVDVLGILDNSDPESFHNDIVNIFNILLESAPMLPLHALSQLGPNQFLKVAVLIMFQVHIILSIIRFILCPIPELFHGNIVRCPQSPLIFIYRLQLLLAYHQYLFILLKICYPKDAQHVSNPLINIYKEGGFYMFKTPTVRSRIAHTTEGP